MVDGHEVAGNDKDEAAPSALTANHNETVLQD